MLEVGSLIKSFVFSILIVFCLQIRLGGETLENHVLEWMHSSKIVGTFQDVAAGGVVLLQDAGRASKKFINETINGRPSFDRTSRAGFQFQRSERFERYQGGSRDEDGFDSSNTSPSSDND